MPCGWNTRREGTGRQNTVLNVGDKSNSSKRASLPTQACNASGEARAGEAKQAQPVITEGEEASDELLGRKAAWPFTPLALTLPALSTQHEAGVERIKQGTNYPKNQPACTEHMEMDGVFLLLWTTRVHLGGRYLSVTWEPELSVVSTRPFNIYNIFRVN